MEDKEIIALYNARLEEAIIQTAQKYGGYCYSIAFRILENSEDSDECINDTYLRVWNSIPPQSPSCFQAFLGKIVRNLSINMYNKRNTDKHKYDTTALILDELKDCIPANERTEEVIDTLLIRETINLFLKDLSDMDKWVFIRRYWYAESIRDIAKALDFTENQTRVLLYRLRIKLKKRLAKEGVYI